MKFDEPAEGDEVISQAGVNLIVDPQSLPFLRDVTLDYSDDLTDSGFKINNPNAARSCGCGTSFEPGASEAATS